MDVDDGNLLKRLQNILEMHYLLKYCKMDMKELWNICLFFLAIFWKVLGKCIFLHFSGTSGGIQSILVANYSYMTRYLDSRSSLVWDLLVPLCHTRNLLEVAGDGSGEPVGAAQIQWWDMVGGDVSFQNPKNQRPRVAHNFLRPFFQRGVIFEICHFWPPRKILEAISGGEAEVGENRDHFH